MCNVCFDCDGCLIDKDKKLIPANVELLKVLSKSHKIFIWSGNGWKYAYEKVGGELGDCVSGFLDKYGTFRPDIAFDDKEIDVGKINIVI